MLLIKVIQSDLSSVGRAEDCSCSNLSSLGRWFESGRSEFFTFDFSCVLNYFPSVKTLSNSVCMLTILLLLLVLSQERSQSHRKCGVFTRKTKKKKFFIKFSNIKAPGK